MFTIYFELIHDQDDFRNVKKCYNEAIKEYMNKLNDLMNP